jgi:radical SAM/Cys-rich protein
VAHGNEFEARLIEATGAGLACVGIDTIQVNLGLCCNQACAHCHLEASPNRTEAMDWPTMQLVLDAADGLAPDVVDLTGGAPELNPDFKRFVKALRARGHPVQVRTNLTVLLEPEMEAMPQFLCDQQVALVASMPCYLEENVRAQRGSGVYARSIEAIRRLNSVGFGFEPQLPLNLVYNPRGPSLPAEQSALEADYRRELGGQFGVSFSRLLTITNMSLGRFKAELRRQSAEAEYLELLKDSFNPLTLDGLMCRHQVSIGWDGTLYDCDFNLALDLPVDHGVPNHIRDLDAGALAARSIVTGDHCFGCTAGHGSSCRGALAQRHGSP